MALRQDLRSDQNINFLRMNLATHVLPGVLTTRAVAIDPQDSCTRKSPRERGLDALCALPEWQQIVISAIGTSRRDSLLVTAMVALQSASRGVHDELCRASLAIGRPVATPAHEDRRVTPPIDEHQTLLSALDGGVDDLQQFLRQPVNEGRIARIDVLDLRCHPVDRLSEFE